MTRRQSGWALVGIAIVMGLWFCSQYVARPLALIPAAGATAPPPGSNDPSGDTRVFYRQGQYPQLRARNGETHEVHSVLNVERQLAFGDYVWNASGVAPGRIWVRIDLHRQMLSVFRGGDEIGTAVVIYGANDHPTPVGVFHILQKSQFYHSKTYDAPMPFALRLTADGVALHASNVRERVATHGCIGLPMEFARMLYAVTNLGDQVEILPESGA